MHLFRPVQILTHKKREKWKKKMSISKKKKYEAGSVGKNFQL